MQTAEQLTRSAVSGIASTRNSPTRPTPVGQTACGPTTSPERKEQITALVAQVFTRLAAMFPRTWASAFPTEQVMTLARREMASELARWPAMPTRQVVERAMSEIRNSGSTWPPTIPVLIKALAPTPEDFGMPATAEAWREVTSHAHEPERWRWSHEAVRLAGAAVGWWDLTHTTAQSQWPRMERRFEREYQALINRVMAGEQLQPRALLESDNSRAPAELAARAGAERAAKQAAEEGLPSKMNSDQGLRAMRAALGRA